ncbi:hypothetical protein WICPIJ_004211 [Wickerhamomyces pijperi]|uniref:Myb-like domain-containing protein n=1 Tax=Wickerhamomyces pijperi TaxID=599730 RepID=A0A9P8TNH5_WICPI|nr:hypothetical protein WICPIJ_004211 [Wickerhamomyces pijperi]
MVSSISPTRRSSTTTSAVTSSSSQAKTTVTRTPTSWDPADDKLLRHLKEVQKLGWKEIASNFTNRTPNACQFRWRRLKSGSLKSLGYSQAGPLSPLDVDDGRAGAGAIDLSATGNTRTPTPMSHSIMKNGAYAASQGSSTATTPPPPHELQHRLSSKLTAPASMGKGSSAIASDSSDNASSPEGYAMMSRGSSPKTDTPSPPIGNTRGVPTTGRPNWSHFKGGNKMLKKDSSSTTAIEEESDSSFDDGDSSDELNNANSCHSSTAITNTPNSSVFTVASNLARWSSEEDELLAQIRHRRSLSFTELSILLPTKSEFEIRSRIDELTAFRSRVNSLQSTLSSVSTTAASTSTSTLKSRSNSSFMIEPYLFTKSATATTSQMRSKRNSMSKQINPYPLPLKSTRSQSISTSSRPRLSSVSSATPTTSITASTSIYSSSPNPSFLSQDFIRSRSLSFSISSASLTSSNTNQNSICSNERTVYRKDSISHPQFNSAETFPRRKSSIFGIGSMAANETHDDGALEDDD